MGDIDAHCHIISIYCLVRRRKMMVQTDFSHLRYLCFWSACFFATRPRVHIFILFDKKKKNVRTEFIMCLFANWWVKNVNKTFECVSLSKKFEHNSNNGAAIKSFQIRFPVIQHSFHTLKSVSKYLDTSLNWNFEKVIAEYSIVLTSVS